ncbi:MAG: hypothetical protein RL033_1108 [Pseudomonadota bacterium]|jgi:hypothetical protein
MNTNWLRVSSITSTLIAASTLFLGCSAGDMEDSSSDGAELSADEASEQLASYDEESELGTAEQGLMSCTNPDGTNAAMAAFAVLVARDLGRWDAARDFKMITTSGVSETSPGMQQAIALTSGNDAKGPIGKSKCADGKCARVQAILAMQYDNLNGLIYFQGTGSTKVQLNPSALRSRMYAKWQDQKACDASAKDNDVTKCPVEQHALTFVTSAPGGCDTNFTFAAKTTTGTALKYVNQLKNKLAFADINNPYINFTNLGNGSVSVDPTYGLGDENNTSPGSCAAACTKVSTTSVAGQCCSCAGVTKTYKVTSNANLFMCQ